MQHNLTFVLCRLRFPIDKPNDPNREIQSRLSFLLLLTGVGTTLGTWVICSTFYYYLIFWNGCASQEVEYDFKIR